MIRVVFVLQEPTPYRAPHLARVAELPELDVTVIYAARTVQRRDWEIPDASDRTIYLRGRSLPATRLLSHDYAVTPGVWSALTRLRPDVLVIGGWSLMATQLAIVWARIHHVPYLLMSDNNLREPRPFWVRAVKRVVLRAIVPQAAGWLVPGSLGRDHILRYGAVASKTVVFPLTIDVDRTRRLVEERRARRTQLRSAFGIPDDGIAVLHVGRLVRQKGIDVLVEAVARARAAVPELHLVIIGSGPEEERLRVLAAGHKLPVVFAGFRGPEALLDAYAAADVFCLLSRRETWGVVVNEAATAALPLVLSRNVGASADLLEQGENGEIIPPGDPDAAATALVRLARDAELRRRYGLRSAAIAGRWGYGPSVTALAELIREVVA